MINKLPLELWCKIFDFIEDEFSQFEYLTLCKLLYIPARQLYYRSVRIKGNRALKHLLERLRTSDFGVYITRIFIRSIEENSDTDAVQDMSLDYLVSRCPKVERLYCYSTAIWKQVVCGLNSDRWTRLKALPRFDYYDFTREEYVRAIYYHRFSLTRLDIYSWLSFQKSIPWSTDLCEFPSITELNIERNSKPGSMQSILPILSNLNKLTHINLFLSDPSKSICSPQINITSMIEVLTVTAENDSFEPNNVSYITHIFIRLRKSRLTIEKPVLFWRDSELNAMLNLMKSFDDSCRYFMELRLLNTENQDNPFQLFMTEDQCKKWQDVTFYHFLCQPDQSSSTIAENNTTVEKTASLKTTTIQRNLVLEFQSRIDSFDPDIHLHGLQTKKGVTERSIVFTYKMDRIELEDWISIICSMLKSNTSEITTLKYDFAECSVFDEEYIELVQNHRISNAFAVSRFTKLERVILTYYISDVKSPFKGQSNPCVKYLKLKKMGITNRWMSDTLNCFRGLNVIELSFCVITLQDGCDTHSFYFDQSFLKLDRIDLVRFRVRRIINEFQHTGYVSYMIVIMKKQRYVRGFLLSEEGSRMLDVDEPTYQTVLREKNTNISLKYVPIIYLMVDQYVKEINFYDSNSSGRKLLENINFDI